jgi:acyl-CoA synthetase (AMP-forming)/AMP-acid ligase II/acyl carrier protein
MSTFLAHLERRVAAAPDAIAFAAHGRSPLSFGQLVNHIHGTIEALRRAGVGTGDRVGIVLPGGPEMAAACLAVASGAVATPINPDFKQAEYEQNLKRLKVKLVLTLEGGQHPIRAAANACGIPVAEVKVDARRPAGLFEIIAAPGAAPAHAGPAQSDDVAVILQTSGTTSVPKTVPLTQRNLVASARNLIASLQLTAADRCLHFLPMFHIGGIVDVLIAPLMAGGGTFIEPSFASADFYRDLKAWRPTWTQAVPVMQQELVNTADAHREELEGHCLRFIRSVSAPLPVPLMEAVEKRFGIPVIEIFGMTETAGVITSNQLPPGKRKPGFVGASAGMEVRILDSNNQPLGMNQVGEVVVRGDNLMAGYEDNPDENARLISDAGFRTGDLGYLDEDGFLRLTGRVKDMINRGGEKVSPHEVDQLLLAHPAVADAASFPVPHPTLGEDVGAVVVLREGASATPEQIKDYLRERVAFFKVPRTLRFVDEIPRGANGKLQRAVLTDKFGKAEAGAAAEVEYVAPTNPIARTLTEFWGAALGRERIGMNDDFFLAGGDSLKAAGLINALQQRFGDTIYVSSVFDAPTPAQYEHYLRQQYPEVVARMLGQAIAPKAAGSPRLTPQVVAAIEAAIPHALRASPVLSARKNKRAVFVLSTPRTGSTLFRAMLAGHSKLFSPPELYLLAYENMAERRDFFWFTGAQKSQLEGNTRALMELRGVDVQGAEKIVAELEARACPTQEYYALMQEWLGDRILVDKTPAYAMEMETLRRAEDYFEDAVYIHLQRHPYGMIRSFEEARLEQLWFYRMLGQKIPNIDDVPYHKRQFAEAMWVIFHRNIRDFLAGIPKERKLAMHFEDVTANPEASMRKVCDLLGLGFDAGMLEPQKDSKKRMTDGVHEISRMIGDPKFHQHKKIDSAVADQWKSAFDVDFLSDQTIELMNEFGYTETIASAHGRTEIEI